MKEKASANGNLDLSCVLCIETVHFHLQFHFLGFVCIADTHTHTSSRKKTSCVGIAHYIVDIEV